MGATSAITASDCADALEALRDRPPLVQCLTNIVVAQWTANVLLAVGAAPAMVDNPHEAAAFAAIAGGVLVNLGTPYDDTVVAMERAVSAATDHGTPGCWTRLLRAPSSGAPRSPADLLAAGRPAVIRGNASEVLALTGGAGGKGVDSVAHPGGGAGRRPRLAVEHRTVVAVSGPVDHLTDGDRVVRVDNGAPAAHQGDRRGLRPGRADGRLRRRRRRTRCWPPPRRPPRSRSRPSPPRRPAAAPGRSRSPCWTSSPR